MCNYICNLAIAFIKYYHCHVKFFYYTYSRNIKWVLIDENVLYLIKQETWSLWGRQVTISPQFASTFKNRTNQRTIQVFKRASKSNAKKAFSIFFQRSKKLKHPTLKPTTITRKTNTDRGCNELKKRTPAPNIKYAIP